MGRDALLADEATLSQLFGLLVSAHYRTTPNDLRNLLDGPNLSIYLLRYQGQVVGAALVAQEGGLDGALAEAVSQGKRRLRGHLIPQSLALHAQLREAAGMQGARIMRLAIHPAVHRRGLGSCLYRHIHDHARGQGLDWIGVSYGATVDLMRFWQDLGLQAVRVGFSRDHASASHSVMMMRGLSEQGLALCFSARARFANYFPAWLSDPLSELDSNHALFLLQGIDAAITLTPQDLRQVRAFALGACTYEDSAVALARLALAGLTQEAQDLSGPQRQVVLLKLVQHHPWERVACSLNLTGRQAVIKCLRQAAQVLLHQRY
jgi:tRNA(Met) cytidine acetyltransferase